MAKFKLQKKRVKAAVKAKTKGAVAPVVEAKAVPAKNTAPKIRVHRQFVDGYGFKELGDQRVSDTALATAVALADRCKTVEEYQQALMIFSPSTRLYLMFTFMYARIAKKVNVPDNVFKSFSWEYYCDYVVHPWHSLPSEMWPRFCKSMGDVYGAMVPRVPEHWISRVPHSWGGSLENKPAPRMLTHRERAA